MDAVVRPEAALVGLCGILGVGDCREVGEGLLIGVVRGEGDVALRVPVFGGDFEGEGVGEECVDGGENGAAIGDRETTGLCEVLVGGGDEEVRKSYGWAKVLLDIYDDQSRFEVC